MSPECFAPDAPGSLDLLERDVTSFAAIGLDEQFTGRIVAEKTPWSPGLPAVAAVY